MHSFVMVGAAPREKQSNQGYKDEHLGSWPVHVWRCGSADQLVSEQRPPSHEQDLVCSQPMNMQTRIDVTDKYRYVCNISKHNVYNILCYAFVTDGEVVTLPAGSPQGLGMGTSLQSPI